MSDFLDRILARLQAEVSQGTPLPEAVQRVETEARQLHGGCKVHVRAKSPRRQERLEQAIAQGLPLPDAFAAAGMPRATGYTALARMRRRGK